MRQRTNRPGFWFFKLLTFLMPLLWLPACLSYTSLNTADSLDWGEVQLGTGVGTAVVDNDAIGVLETDLRVGLTGWMDTGLKVEGMFASDGGMFNLVMLDAKFQYLDEKKHWLNAAVQPGMGIGLFGSDAMLAALFSKKFGRYEPVFAYRYHHMTISKVEAEVDNDDDDDDDNDEEDDDSFVLYPGDSISLSDLFVGVRIEMLNWLYLFPEVGVSIFHETGVPMYHANLGVQFQFD